MLTAFGGYLSLEGFILGGCVLVLRGYIAYANHDNKCGSREGKAYYVYGLSSFKNNEPNWETHHCIKQGLSGVVTEGITCWTHQGILDTSVDMFRQILSTL